MDTYYLSPEITDDFKYWVGYDFDVHWKVLVLQGADIYGQGSLWVPADVARVSVHQIVGFLGELALYQEFLRDNATESSG